MHQNGPASDSSLDNLIKLIKKLTDILSFVVQQRIYYMLEFILRIIKMIHPQSRSNNYIDINITRANMFMKDKIQILRSLDIPYKDSPLGLWMHVHLMPMLKLLLDIIINHLIIYNNQ